MTLTIASFGRALLVLLVVVAVARPLWRLRKQHEFVAEIWSRFTVRGLLATLVVLPCVFSVAMLLENVPGFDRGWTSLLFDGWSGNMLFAPFREAMASPHLLIRAGGFVFFAAVVYLLPFIVAVEEDFFRKGHVRWPAIVRQSVKFGLVHCLVGIPIASGVALILPGLYFGWVYKRTYEKTLRETPVEVDGYPESEAVMASITAHTLYDVVALAWVLGRALLA